MIILASAILVLALLVTTGSALYSMYQIQEDGERAMLEQMDIRLQNLAESKAMLADSILSVYTGDVRTLVGYAEELYRKTPEPIRTSKWRR